MFRASILMVVVFTVLTGFVYPLVITGLARVLFPHQAAGSLIEEQGRVVGSERIGQQFHGPEWFHGRPSATGPAPYSADASTGSNLGPSNPALIDAVTARIAALRALDPTNSAPVPIDLVTASGSGLDPEISPAAAQWQVARVARARGLDEATVRALVEQSTRGRQLGILGEPGVNVLALNRALAARSGR